MRRLWYATGIAIGLAAGITVGFAVGNPLLGVLLASIVTSAACYMIWEVRTLGVDAADLPRRDSSGEAATLAGVTAEVDGRGEGGSFGG